MMNTSEARRIILASTSPRRRELVASLHLPFEVIPSLADETVEEGWKPERIVTELAKRKAEAVYHLLETEQRGGVIIGSDTIVVRDGTVLGKPADKKEAADMLRSLQGRTHEVFSGIACMDSTTGKSLVNYKKTIVTMREMKEEEVLAYADTGEGLDKAGAYAIQGLGATIVTGIEGCYFNVVGLPLSLLSKMLETFGISVL